VRKTSISHAAGALALATLLVTWLPLADAQAAEIRIGFANGSSADYAPAFAAEKLGSFKQAGLDVRLIAFRGGAAAQEALTAGAADIIAYFGPAVALAVSKGVKEKMVATILAGHSGWNLIVPTDSPARSVKDLASKKVGISTKASTSDMAALWIAEQAGISMAQIPLGAGALIPSLRSHQVDAIVFSALLTMRETLAGRARSLMDVGATMPATMANVYVASEDMLVNRPQELRAALAVIYKTLAYMQANRAWSMSYLKDFAKSDSDELTAALYDGIFPKLSPDGHIEKTWIAEGLTLAARAWEVPELAKVDADTLYTNEFHPAAP
jgi:NitT/TauT family transport system substrate-binding protein